MFNDSQPFLYFAYGFNLNLAQMRQRCPNNHVFGIARLTGYRIGFFGHSANWDGAVETIVPHPQSEVWGVLYQLDTFDWRRLDEWQDARDDGRGAYFHFPVKVLDMQQLVRTVITYRKDSLGKPERPSTEYLSIIIQGAREHGLPENYLAELSRIRAKPALYVVPCKHGLNGMSGRDCGECTG